MVRSRLAIVGLILLIVAVLAAKATLSPHRRAADRPVVAEYAKERPASPAAAPKPEAAEPEAEKGAELTGADLAKCLKSGKPTLADFGEGWCEQCKKMVPVLAAATKQYRGKANVVFVDTKAYPEHAQTYKIVRIPTQVFFDAKGKEVNRHIGYYPIEDIAKEMAKVGVGGGSTVGSRK